MAALKDPFDPDTALGCSCGHHANQAEHDRHERATALDDEAFSRRLVEATLLKAIFPRDSQRRRFLKAVGSGTAMAALSGLLPVGALQSFAAEKGGTPEKKDLTIGFLPITCATPIIFAGAANFYAKEGLNVTLAKTAGWAVVRDKTLSKEYDASHMLSPMPLAISMGAGSAATPMVMPVMENINGNGITLHMKHKDNRDPSKWQGMKFAIPFDYSMHNFLLRHYLASHGLDPDKDVQLRVMAPPDMVANLKSGNIDGFIVAEPFNQRAVYEGIGFIHTLTNEIWDGHPCCAFAATKEFSVQNPNTFAALVRALMRSTQFVHQAENRKGVAEMIAPANYLNQPVTVVEQVLTGRYADGLGQIRNTPGRIDFDPFPWQSMAVWMLTQMKRWGYVKADINYKDIAEKVFLATDARKRMAELGIEAPKSNYKRHQILGKEFDAAQADAYLKGLARPA
jgi:nitrate/nitrite transport system substrate-binding protein